MIVTYKYRYHSMALARSYSYSVNNAESLLDADTQFYDRMVRRVKETMFFNGWNEAIVTVYERILEE